jgi:hypothetical protein
VARLILGELTAPIVAKLATAYGLPEAVVRRVNQVTTVTFASPGYQGIRGKEDLVTEWIVKNLGQNPGWRTRLQGNPEAWQEDRFRYYQGALWFLDPTHRDALRGLSRRLLPTHNPKNILDYTLSEVEDLKEEVESPTDPGHGPINPRALPEGSRIVYQDPTWMVVEFTDPESACRAGMKTRWCTRLRMVDGEQPGDPWDPWEEIDLEYSETEGYPSTAAQYLQEGPLYVFWKNGKKVAQAHVGDHQVQLKDIKDNDLDPRGEITVALERSGILERVLHLSLTAEKPDLLHQWWPAGPNEEKLQEMVLRDPHRAVGYARLRVKGRWPAGEPVIAQNPLAAYEYAHDVLKGRFPRGEAVIAASSLAPSYAREVIHGPWPDAEPVIARNPRTAYEYAFKVLKGRFPLGEATILADPSTATHYRNHLRNRGISVESLGV